MRQGAEGLGPRVGQWLGPVGAMALTWVPRPDGLTEAAWRVAAVALWMVVWWLLDAVPRAITALLPLLLFGPLGIQAMGAVGAAYAHPLLVLMGAGFVLGHAMERVSLHERLTAGLLQLSVVRAGPRGVLAALMMVTALLSGLVSNTATTLMMLPLAGAFAHLSEDADALRPAYVLGIAYAASIGGMSTLIGTPPNAVLAGLSADLLGEGVGFARWLLVGVPTVLLMLPAAWWCVSRLGYRMPDRFGEAMAAPAMPTPRWGEGRVLRVVLASMVLWGSRGDKDLGFLVVPGWERWLPGKGYELDAAVALLAALCLLVLPGPRREDGTRPTVVSWREAERALPWSVLLLLGGGFALAGGIANTGLTSWLAGGATALASWSPISKVLAVCFSMTFLTEITSNTATAQIVLPVLAEASATVRMEPLVWMVPAALSSSCAFMMPVATAPNAIAAEAGHVDTRAMLRAGLALNLYGAVVMSLLGVTLVPWVFGH